MDLQFINVGQSGGKDAVDKIVEDLPTAPFSSRYKVVLFDECHKLTSAAQDLLLMIIEKGYQHVFFMFVTNKPEKLTAAFIQRCSVMHFERIPKELIFKLLYNVAESEGMPYKEDVLDHISEKAEGVPRTALVYLDQVNAEGSWTMESAKEITGILIDEGAEEIIALCKAVMKGKWDESKKILSRLNTSPESIRLAMFGYFAGGLRRSSLFSGGRYSSAMEVLDSPIYETGKTGENRLLHYIYKVINIWRIK
jgi:DNA polymerase III gamma/tau subunit